MCRRAAPQGAGSFGSVAVPLQLPCIFLPASPAMPGRAAQRSAALQRTAVRAFVCMQTLAPGPTADQQAPNTPRHHTHPAYESAHHHQTRPLSNPSNPPSPYAAQSEVELRRYRDELGLPPARWAEGGPIPLGDAVIASTEVGQRRAHACVRGLFSGGCCACGVHVVCQCWHPQPMSSLPPTDAPQPPPIPTPWRQATMRALLMYLEERYPQVGGVASAGLGGWVAWGAHLACSRQRCDRCGS